MTSNGFDPMAVSGTKSGKMAAAGDDTHAEGGDAKPAPRLAPKPGHEVSSSNVAADQLRSFIERIERLEEEKAIVADDIKSVYGELKGKGFDSKAVRTIVRIRKKDISEFHNSQAVLDTYLMALGMLEADHE